MNRIPVLLCSPYAASDKGDRATNDRYLKACMADSLARNEAPFASHAMYPQFLDDADCDQRALGLECEHVWLAMIAPRRYPDTTHGLLIAYTNLGISSGMAAAMHEAVRLGIPILQRVLAEWK